MSKKTVDITRVNELCISCGICKGICPCKSITYKRIKGLYVPEIDKSSCVDCGMCADVCPGLQFEFSGETALDAIKGSVISSYNAWSKNATLRHRSASGGAVSTIIRKLLEDDVYDAVFCLDVYNYDGQLKLTFKDKNYYQKTNCEHDKTMKSRYLPASHEFVVEYIKNNPDSKIIIVGTSCALQGIERTISRLKRNRNNYLFIGLFCDKVFNYNLIDYFKSKQFSKDKNLSELHFKNKDSGGWPGNMKFIFSDGSSCFYNQNIRLGLKDFFTPERCFYCIDKLNVIADISVGDNFTSQDGSPLGSNSVLLRTERGKAAFELCFDELEYNAVSEDLVFNAQAITNRAENYKYSKIKIDLIKDDSGLELCLNSGITLEAQYNENDQKRFAEIKTAFRVGEEYNLNPRVIKKSIAKKTYEAL